MFAVLGGPTRRQPPRAKYPRARCSARPRGRHVKVIADLASTSWSTTRTARCSSSTANRSTRCPTRSHDTSPATGCWSPTAARTTCCGGPEDRSGVDVLRPADRQGRPGLPGPDAQGEPGHRGLRPGADRRRGRAAAASTSARWVPRCRAPAGSTSSNRGPARCRGSGRAYRPDRHRGLAGAARSTSPRCCSAPRPTTAAAARLRPRHGRPDHQDRARPRCTHAQVTMPTGLDSGREAVRLRLERRLLPGHPARRADRQGRPRAFH